MSDATCLIAVSFKSLGNGRYVPDTELYTLLSVMGNSNLLMQDYMKTSSYKIGSYFFSSVQCEPWGEPYVPDRSDRGYVSIDGFTPSCAEGLTLRFFNAFLMSYQGALPMVLPKPRSDSTQMAVSAEIGLPWNGSPESNPYITRQFSRGVEVRGSEFYASYEFLYQLVRFTFKV